jgi:hypothetical protein
MLYYETIDAPTLGLLKQLQQIPAFADLRLAGGTSLALQTGHRKSVDIDLFGTIQDDEYEVAKTLRNLGKVTTIKKSTNIGIYLINDIKTDIVNYTYPWLQNAIIKDGLRLAGEKDIAAMKLAAITGRGTKKDFIDLFFLLKKFTLREMLDLYLQKYNDGSELLVLKSLSYFNDAEKDELPVMLQSVDWETIKAHISNQLANIK